MKYLITLIICLFSLNAAADVRNLEYDYATRPMFVCARDGGRIVQDLQSDKYFLAFKKTDNHGGEFQHWQRNKEWVLIRVNPADGSACVIATSKKREVGS